MDPRDEPQWLPISIENEQAVLGTVLANNETFDLIRDMLRPEHFHEPIHRLIFECCVNLLSLGKPASPLSLKPFIAAHQVTEGMTVAQYLARLAAESLPSSMLRQHATIVRDLAARRALGDVAYDLTEALPKDVLQLAGKAIGDIDSVISELSHSSTRSVSASGMMAGAVEAAARAFEANGRIIGIPTGLTKLDRKLLGFTRGDLVIMGGRPGMGKSACMVTMARTMAEAGYKGAIFSQEMSEIALGQRMIADKMFGTGPINYFNFRSGRFDERAFERITQAAEEISHLQLYVDPAPSQTFSQIASKARQRKARHGLDFLFVDHLQIMQMAARYNTRNDQIGEITSGFKALAKELDIVVILLCQLSRALESRDSKRPTLGDLRDSGNIEQDADVVIMLYREMYYLERRQPPPGTPEHAVWQTSVTRAENRLEMLVEKQRAGPTGTIEVFCNIGCNAVRNLDEHEVLATAASGAAADQEPVMF